MASLRRLSAVLILVLAVTVCANSQVASRIRGPIDPSQTVTLAGSTSKLLKGATDLGPLPAGTSVGQLVLMLTPDAEQEAAFDAAIEQMHVPSSPLYHRWLTPEQIGERYGVAEQDAAQVKQWLESSGLTVHRMASSRRFVIFGGTAQQVGRAFGTEMHSYRNAHGEFVANASAIRIPAALQRVVGGIALSGAPRRRNVRIVGPVPIDPVTKQISFTNGLHVITPGDFNILYNVGPLWQAGIDGSGQSIAIVARSNLDPANIRDFRSWFMPQYTGNDPVIVVNGTDPGDVGGDDFETMLDATWSGAVAPKATVKVVVTASIVNDGIDVSAGYIVDTNLAPVMSTSYGSCEDDMGPGGVAYYGSLWKQAAAQGITSIVSSGDSGGAGCDNPNSGAPAFSGFGVNGLASTPYNVALGGTQFDEGTGNFWGLTNAADGSSVKSYIPEKVWNESSMDVNDTSIWASGGGPSNTWKKPNWQTGKGVPNDGVRDIPDVSLSASIHDGYAVCFDRSCSGGSLYYVGGTSASAPAFAGLMALVNQKTKSIQGNANYTLYALAAQSPNVFHDIVNGDNMVPNIEGGTTGFASTPGYDMATGWGSVDATAMVNNWANIKLASSAITLTGGLAGTVTHGVPVPFSVAVTAGAGGSGVPSGNVTFFADSTPVGPAVDLAADGTATALVRAIPAGTHNVTARYGGDGRFLASVSSPIPMTVAKEAVAVTFLTSSFFNVTQASYGEPVLVGALVNAVSSAGFPTGRVDFLVGSTNVGSGVLDFANEVGSSTMLEFPAAFPVGSYTIVAKYAGDSNFNGGTSLPAGFKVTKADSSTSFSAVGAAVANVPLPLSGRIFLSNGGTAPISGTVKFQDVTGATPVDLATATVSSSGSFSATITPGATPMLVTGTYSGDGNLNGSFLLRSISPAAKGSTSTKVTTSAATVAAGASVTLTASVTTSVFSKVPSGTVTFLDGTTTLGTGTLNSSAAATFATTSLGGGVHTITAAYGGDPTFNTSTSTAVTQTVSDFAVQATPSSVTIKQGASAAVAFVVQPQGGYKGTVSFSCTGLPANMGCTFSPASVTPDGVNAVTSTLTITTDGSVHASNRPMDRRGGWLATTFALAFGVVLVPAGMRRRGWIALTMVAVLLAGGLIACGGGSSKTTTTTPTTNTSFVTAGSYTVNVSAATTGSASHQASVAINVTQ